MRNLKLADHGDLSFECVADILFGIDFYYNFFTGKTIRKRQADPVAGSTVLGWVLSGWYSATENILQLQPPEFFSGLSFETYAMRVASNKVKDLREDLKCFWEVEIVGYREGEMPKTPTKLV